MSPPKCIAVTSRSFPRHPVLRRELEARLRGVTLNDAGDSLHGDDLTHFLWSHEGAITTLETIDETVLTG